MNTRIMGIVAILLVLGVTLAVRQQNKKEPVSPPTPTASETSATSTPSIDLGRGDSSYSDKRGVFSVLYPNDYTLDTQDPLHIRIYKRGASERPQGEMSDGILMVFEPIELQGTPLESWVNTRISQSTTDGTTKITDAKKSITHNGYSGYSYAIGGFGSSQNIVLQKNKDSLYALLITYAVNDPEQKGYQKEIDAIMSSLELIK